MAEFIDDLKLTIQTRGYVGLSLDDHCCVIVWSDNNFYIVDSYVHSEKHLRCYDRKLSKRLFNFDEFRLLLEQTTIGRWNTLFDNHATKLIDVNLEFGGVFSHLNIHY